MERSPLWEWVKTTPFNPFVVPMSNGREVRVMGPEMIILGRRRDIVSFVDDEGYDRHVVIYHNKVTTVGAYDPMQTHTPGS